ncbi:MAG TPA: CopG family transcriptional regulator [Ensifer sp.]|nr:CopG family transcriptional regulator [Ensifer sp.]
MTKAPTIPRSNRNLADLDALINQSIGKDPIGSALAKPEVETDENFGAKAPPIAPPIPDEPATNAYPRGKSSPIKLERLQVKIPDDVLLAMKFEALRQKRSPSAIVELALRQYLNPQKEA